MIINEGPWLSSRSIRNFTVIILFHGYRNITVLWPLPVSEEGWLQTSVGIAADEKQRAHV